MRIIAGEFRGRTIKAPKGDGTRPTTDRVRESLMSAVNSACGGFEGATVLDAFAGSGALGLEALSRGAACAHFFRSSSCATGMQNTCKPRFSPRQTSVLNMQSGSMPSACAACTPLRSLSSTSYSEVSNSMPACLSRRIAFVMVTRAPPVPRRIPASASARARAR